MQDKIALLMEETGCDRGQAELALEMCGYELEKAVKAIPYLLKNIVVVKGKFVLPGRPQFGLLLLIANLKDKSLLRTRAVLSFNPAVYDVALDADWFEFERHLFGCRLWDGSLQVESQEIEQALAAALRASAAVAVFDPKGPESSDDVARELGRILRASLRDDVLELKARKEILDLGHFQSLQGDAGLSLPAARPDAPPRRRGGARRPDGPLVLRIALEEDPEGVAASELRAGELVNATLSDTRDIARYLWKFLGGHSETGPLPIPVPVEAIESVPGGGGTDLMVRARFAAGVCGDARADRTRKVKVVRSLPQERPWWQRIFNR